MIGVNAIARVLASKRLAAVERNGERSENPHFVGVGWIDADLTVVARARVRAALARPRRASIVGPVDAAGALVLDHRVDDVRAALRDVDTDPAEISGRQSLAQFLPRVAAVERAEQGGAGPAADEAESATAALVRRGVHGAAVGVDCDLADAGITVDEQHLLPGFPTIFRAVQTALLVWSPQVTHRGGEHDVRIGRVDRHAANVVRLLQAHVLPGVATVDRLVNTVAP